MSTIDTIDTWEKVNNEYTGFASSGKRWLFRGQQHASWLLEPTLERTLKRFGYPLTELRTREEHMLRHVKRNFHRYSSYLPPDDDNGEWLTLLQHHGAPTRLLDWTYSFHIALFFALEKASIGDTCALYAVDNDFVADEMKRVFKDDEKGLYKISDKNPKLFNKLIEEEVDLIMPMCPFRMTERLAVQQGIFLLSRCTTKPFSEIFDRAVRLNTKAFKELKIVCSKELLVEALTSFQRMNIGRVSLFPGIDGFCQSFENLLPVRNLWTYLIPTGTLGA